MLHRFKGLALLSLSCVLAWTGWTGSSQAASTLSEKALEAKVEWSREYGESYASAQARSVVPTADGGYVAVGSAEYNGDEAGYVVKVDKDGAVEWEQRLQITGDYTKDGVEARQIIQTQDGGYLVSGAITDRTERPITLPYLAKLDGQGQIEWTRYYKDLYIGTHLYAGSAVETPDGGFAVTGYSVNSYWEAPAYLLKVDNEGNRLWFKTYRFGEGNNQVFNEVISTPDGGLLAVGYIDSVINSNTDASVIVKVDAQGEVEWENKQPAPQTGRAAYSVQLSADGGYIVYGTQQQNGERIAFLLKADAEGNSVWEKNYSPHDDNGSYRQLVTTKDGYALLGSSTRKEDAKYQYQISYINQDGELTGKLQYAATGLAAVGKGAPTSDGGFILSGQVKENGKYRMQLVKLSGTGQEPGDPELAELRFADPAVKLEIGERKPSVIEAVYLDGSVTDVTYFADFTSLNPEIADVDKAGMLTGITSGTAEIIGEYGGLRAVLSVVVNDGSGEPQPGPGQFCLDSEDYSVTVGSELDIEALFTDENGNTLNITGETQFTTANPEIAQIDESGYITGISRGLTSVTAVYQGHAYTSSLLVVRPYTPPSVMDNFDDFRAIEDLDQ
ncbi:hypothetical protein [Paenibacillus macerans]|uniref:hypothetical protein n=1 Tax=Paenibacillus macerans TaxID=44252 RepID=UPI00203AB43A|nr:hypothetical protein [Paenibacillus macerans]MCM3701388.1 hypothetical protein [Paenibacillus macerans]